VIEWPGQLSGPGIEWQGVAAYCIPLESPVAVSLPTKAWIEDSW